MPERNPRTQNKRLTTAVLAVIFAAQWAFAALSILAPPLREDPSSLAVIGALIVYALAVVAFGAGVILKASWLWPLAVTIAAGGLLLAALRFATGTPLDELLLGMVIDGLLLYYLPKPHIRSLFVFDGDPA